MGKLPQRTRITKRAGGYRKALRAVRSRNWNKTIPKGIFKPNVKLDPSQVVDRRGSRAKPVRTKRISFGR